MKCEVWSVKFQVRSAKSAVKSVECEDFASSLAEKIKRLSREGHGRDRVSLNYRSFMFGKLPPPACPGLCYMCLYMCLYMCMYIFMYMCMYMCMYMYVYVCICMYMYAYVFLYVFVYVFVYVYVYVHVYV